MRICGWWAKGRWKGVWRPKSSAAAWLRTSRCPAQFDDVEDCLCAADLFVAAAHDDGGVLALLEAMALGLPSVVTDTAAHRAVIRNGDHGRLVPVAQPPALAAAIADIFCQADEAARLGREARGRRKASFLSTAASIGISPC